MTTSLVDLDRRPRDAAESLDGVTVHYLGTPVRYRWMGVTPTIRRRLDELERPDVSTCSASATSSARCRAGWARRRRLPYVFEGLGMVRPMLRKVALKRAADRTVYRPVVERRDTARRRIRARARRLPRRPVSSGRVSRSGRSGSRRRSPPIDASGPAPKAVALDESAPVLLSVGRVAPGKGLDLLIRSLPELDGVHLAIVGPDDRGTAGELTRLGRELGVDDRLHLTGAWPDPASLLDLYADADVFALASAYESFGIVAAEAAAAGTASVVSDRCGIADLLRDGAALVVPYDQRAVREALARLFADRDLRLQLGESARAVAAEWSWPKVVELQETLYDQALG